MAQTAASGDACNSLVFILHSARLVPASAVVLGAFAAHGLKARLDAAALGVFQTGVTYQFLHSLALCVLALWLLQGSRRHAR